jgi:hypothetical protein
LKWYDGGGENEIAYSGVALCTPTWINHDYGDWGVVDILAVGVYFRMDVCMPIFMGEASN